MALAVFWILTHIRVNTDLSQFLPKDSVDHQLLVKAVKNNPGTSILIISLRGSDAERLAQLNRTLARAISRLPGVARVANGDLRAYRRYRDFLLKYHLLLNPQLSADYFSVRRIKAGLDEIIDALNSPIPLLDKTLVRHDPLGSVIDVLKSWKHSTAAGRRYGVWFSKDGKESFILVQTAASGFEINKQERLVKAVQQELRGRLPAGVEVTLSGPGYFASLIRNRIQDDIYKLTIAAVALVSLLLIGVYRALTPLLYCVLPLASGIVAGIVSVLLLFGGIHSITLAFGITLVGVTIDYPIHLFTHIRRGTRAVDSMAGIWPTLRLGILTTAIGFTAMLLAGFEGLRQLAVFAVSGLVVAALVTRWLLPHVISPAFSFEASVRSSRFSVAIVELASRFRSVAALAAIAAAVFLWWQPELTDHDIKKLTPLSPQQLSDDRRLRGLVGASNTRYLLTVNDTGLEKLLQDSEALVPVLRGLVREGVIGGFDMAARYLPSRKTQRLRRQMIPAPDVLRRRFAAAVDGTDFRLESFTPFFNTAAAIRQGRALDYEQALRSPIGLKLRILLQRHEQGWLALIPLSRVRDVEVLKQRIGALRNRPGMQHVRLMDIKAESSQALAGYAREAMQWLGWGSLVIMLILWSGLGSWRRLLRVVLPILAALLLTVTVWSLAGVRLNIFHLVSLLLVVGVGIDYALFFIRDTSAEDHRRDYLAIWVSNLTTVIVFGLLYFAYPLVLQAVGGTVALGALFAFFLSASVAKKVD